jgi:hypothetical protein
VTPLHDVDPELAELIREMTERRLSAEEVAAALAVPITDEEAERVVELADWFCRRYPTPGERLDYVRRAYRRWTESVGRGRPMPFRNG